MKILHISDTHGHHKLLQIDETYDMIIHSGDESNYSSLARNIPEAMDFLEWYGNLNIKYKILIAGNHSAMAALDNKHFREQCFEYGIFYLEHESIEIEGLKIFGSPYTPTFGNWFFMRDREELNDYWNQIPEDTDILVTHGPPEGILDLSWSREGLLGMCGCKSLKTHCLNRLNLTLCLFGHIHSNKNVMNAGTMTLNGCKTIFSNGSVLTDGKFGILSSEGNIFNLNINGEKNINS